jgi:hypothetical protein
MLSNKALLVYVSISQWAGRKLDKRATGTVETTFATQSKVGNYTKKLLPGATELAKIGAVAGATRDLFYTNTLPWLADGARILSSKNYLDFVRAFQAKKIEFQTAVDEFLTVYPVLKDQARSKLGALYSDLDYPIEARLRDLFQCEIVFMPMPEVSDFRTEVLDSEKNDFMAKMRDVESKATADCFQRLSDVVARAATKLSSPDAIFRDSLIENITDICGLLPKLNITDNPDLETARLEVEALVSKISPETCRVNPAERQDVARQLADINAKMGAFMGAAA